MTLTEAVSIAFLRQQYPMAKIEGHGWVLVIPADRFDPDWEAQLPKENTCSDGVYKTQVVTFIKLKKTEVILPAPTTPQQPQQLIVKSNVVVATPKVKQKPLPFTEEENALIIDLWNRKYTANKIHTYFMRNSLNRTNREIFNQINVLKDKNLIDSHRGKWQPKDDRLLIELHHNGSHPTGIAKVFHCTEFTIQQRISDLVKLGKITPKEIAAIDPTIQQQLEQKIATLEKKLNVCINHIDKIYNSAKFFDGQQSNHDWNDFVKELNAC